MRKEKYTSNKKRHPNRSRRRSTGTSKRAVAAVVVRRTAKRLTKRSSGGRADFDEEAPRDRTADGRIRPSQWRYLRGKIECLESGHATTTVNVAKRIGVSRVAVWKLQRRYPWLDAWCDEMLREANVHRWGSIMRRMADLAEQGHIGAADQFCKMQSGYYASRGRGSSDNSDVAGHGPIHVVQNYLVPRPEYPKLERPEPVTSGGLMADIPTIAVR
jgi:hypothetical protein